MGVLQLTDAARFALKALHQFRVITQVTVHHFDGDMALDAGLVRLVDLSHPTAPQPFHQFIFAKFATDHLGHKFTPS